MELNYNNDGLIPAIAQHYVTGEVLMMAYMNPAAYEATVNTKKATFWSRSRGELWIKGATSGNFLDVVSIKTDCDNDCVLLLVDPKGPACHTGEISCFYNTVEDFPEEGIASKVLDDVFNVILDRKQNPKEGSYTNYLFDKGIDKILKKVGEESAETIIAAKNDVKDEIKLEVADLCYHVMVMLVDRGLELKDIYEELKGRR